jgi:hypothetical protein
MRCFSPPPPFIHAHFALALLTAVPAEGDASSHSVEGAWIARALHFALAKPVTVKTVLRRKVRFKRPGQAHEDVVFDHMCTHWYFSATTC